MLGKQNLTLILLFFFSNFIFSQSEERADELKTVISAFLDTYSVQYPPQNNVRFLKKPDGYYVVRTKNFLEEIATEKYLNVGSKEFNDLSIFLLIGNEGSPKMYKNENGELIEFVPDLKVEFFKQHWIFEEARKYPFYGYEGYYNDVIEYYEKIKNPSAKSNYAYCRAWSSKLINMVNDNLQYGVQAEKIDLPNLDSKMSDIQLDKFLSVFEMEKKAYRKFSEKYPEYQTKVGHAKLKYAHIVMDGYLKLFPLVDESKSKKVIESNIYEEDYLIKAREILKSCPENSILYTWGDNDTYPFYYLQAIENFRLDLTIINYSLTAMPRYMLKCYGGAFDQLSLKSSFTIDFYKRPKIVMTERTPVDSLCSLNEFIKHISNPFRYQGYEMPNDYLMLPWKGINIELKQGRFGNGKRQFELILERNTFSDLISQLDILFNNEQNRSICFTEQCITETDNPWKDCLRKLQGIYILNEN